MQVMLWARWSMELNWNGLSSSWSWWRHGSRGREVTTSDDHCITYALHFRSSWKSSSCTSHLLVGERCAQRHQTGTCSMPQNDTKWTSEAEDLVHLAASAMYQFRITVSNSSSNFDPLNLLQLPRVGASAKLSVFPLARLSGLKPSCQKSKNSRIEADLSLCKLSLPCRVSDCQCVTWWIKESNWTAAASVQPAVLHSHTHTDWSLSCKSCFATTSNLHLFQTDGSTIHLWN